MKNWTCHSYSPASKKTQIIQDFVVIGTVTILFFHSFSFDLVLENNSYYIIKYLGTYKIAKKETMKRKQFNFNLSLQSAPVDLDCINTFGQNFVRAQLIT